MLSLRAHRAEEPDFHLRLPAKIGKKEDRNCVIDAKNRMYCITYFDSREQFLAVHNLSLTGNNFQGNNRKETFHEENL